MKRLPFTFFSLSSALLIGISVVGLLAYSARPLDEAKPDENRFTKVVLAERLNEPLEMVILPDERVLFIERHGNVQLYSPTTKQVSTIATIPVSTKYKDPEGHETEAEDGLLGINVDPDFATNHWVYLYYSPAGLEPKNSLVRYELRGDELLMASKKVLLDVPTQREQCCHTGGSMDWDRNGNLYLSTGDNTSPRATLYAPIDERDGRSPWDAQKSSANTNDLRGKILRIHPEADGSYTIPDGNLFPKGTAQTGPGATPSRNLHNGPPQPIPYLGGLNTREPCIGATLDRMPVPTRWALARRPKTSTT